MPYRLVPFESNCYYHVFNRGVEKRVIFSTDSDFQRFLHTLYYYQFQGPKPKFSTYKRFKNKDFTKNPKIVEIVCYCLMPNHFHLLLKQLQEKGIQEFIHKVIDSYTKYYNTRHNRVGHLFQGTFKANFIENDEQLIHVSRYIHLNPFVDDLVKDLETYFYSSYPRFLGKSEDLLCSPESVMGFFESSTKYQEFVDDHASYAYDLEKIKHELIDTS